MNTSSANLSRVYTVAELVSVAATAIDKRNGAPGIIDWETILDGIMAEIMPSGSGFDAGTSFVRATASEIVFSTGFHHMNDGGYYDGWTEHTIRARATLSGLSITISGRDRNGIKDYIGDVFHYALTRSVRFSNDGDIVPVAETK